MNEYVAYAGDRFTIEWYFDEAGKSQPLDFFEKLSESRQDKLFYLLKRMGDAGRINDITKFRNEHDGIYAFKPQPDRFLCFFIKGRTIVITNAFTKRQNALPATEKKRALKNKRDYQNRTNKGTYYE